MTTWPERLNLVIGEQIKKHRLRCGFTAQEVSVMVTEMGFPISRSKLANMENGRARQEGISVAEVFVLAAVLDVAPAELMVGKGWVEVDE